MKKVKMIIAGIAAAVMAFSTMSIGASAETWSVYFNPSSPYGVNELDIKMYYAPVTLNYFYDSCTTFNTSPNYNNQKGQVEYWCYCTDQYGNVIHYGTANALKYNSTLSEHGVLIDYAIEQGHYITIKHRLINNGNPSNYSGSVHI